MERLRTGRPASIAPPARYCNAVFVNGAGSCVNGTFDESRLPWAPSRMGIVASLSRLRIGRTGPVELLALVGLGLFLASVGAFDSEDASRNTYPYWVMVLVGGGIVGAMIEPLLWRIPTLAERPGLLAVAQVFCMTPWITVVVWLVSGLYFGQRFSLERYLVLLPPVFVVNIGVVALAVLIRRGAASLEKPVIREAAPPLVMREKLPPKLARADLIAVEAEDHYLRIHTSAGDALILMRLSDAVEALSDRAGFQTHRSWWVARDAVEHARFRQGRGELTLANGLKVPVSRAFAARVKDTEWAAI